MAYAFQYKSRDYNLNSEGDRMSRIPQQWKNLDFNKRHQMSLHPSQQIQRNLTSRAARDKANKNVKMSL